MNAKKNYKSDGNNHHDIVINEEGSADSNEFFLKSLKNEFPMNKEYLIPRSKGPATKAKVTGYSNDGIIFSRKENGNLYKKEVSVDELRRLNINKMQN